MKFMTISELKANAATLDIHEPVTITQNGKPVYVIEPYANYADRQESIALVKLLGLSSQQIKDGNHMTVDELKESLKQRFIGSNQVDTNA